MENVQAENKIDKSFKEEVRENGKGFKYVSENKGKRYNMVVEKIIDLGGGAFAVVSGGIEEKEVIVDGAQGV
jgi:hypothetical protein